LTIGAAVLVCACTAPVVTHTEYQYSLAGPTGEFRPGQALPLTWKSSATVVTGSAPLTSARVCVALVGPYGSVEELKTSTPTARTCPIAVAGAILASRATEADITGGAPIDQTITLPTSLAPGLYSLVSLFAYESGSHGGSTLSSQIVRVIAAP
jgi:hypothetical protein